MGDKVMRHKLRRSRRFNFASSQARFQFALNRRRYKRASRMRRSMRRFEGIWNITGLKGLEVGLLFMGQVGDYVSGQLNVRAGSRRMSYTIVGSHKHPDVLLKFHSGGRVEFIFKGKFQPNRQVEGEFSGRLTGKATLSRVSNLRGFLNGLT